MSLPQWPPGMPGLPLRENYRGAVPGPARKFAMEAGNLRQRAALRDAPVTLDLRWRMDAGQLVHFRSFYRCRLDEGTKWFGVPLWFGGAPVTVPAQFTDRYRIVPRAASAATVSAQLRVRELPYEAPAPEVAAAFLDENGTGVWPAALPREPQFSPFEIDPHRRVLIGDFEEGPAAKRNLFGATPGEVMAAWAMTPAAFEIFKAFYVEGLHYGQRWFRAPLWFGRSLETARIRFTGGFDFAPAAAEMVMVRGAVEILRLPVFGPPELWLETQTELGGESAPDASIEIQIATIL